MMFFHNLTKTQKILLSMFSLGFLAVGIGFLSGLHLSDSSQNFIGKGDRQKLSPNKPITQIFTATENGLSQVKVRIGGVNLIPRDQLVLQLRDASCEQVLAHAHKTAFHLPSHTYTLFNFSRIEDSKGKTYCAHITYRSPYKHKSADLPFIHTTKDESLAGVFYTEVAKDKKHINETLELRPGYRSGNIATDLWSLVERMSQYKSNFIKGTPLLFLLTLTFIGSATLGVYLLSRKEKE